MAQFFDSQCIFRDGVAAIYFQHRLRIRDYRFLNLLKFANFTKFLKFVFLVSLEIMKVLESVA